MHLQPCWRERCFGPEAASLKGCFGLESCFGFASCFGLLRLSLPMGLPRRAALRVPRVIRVGSDFSGIEAGVTALGRMGINYKLLFSCDSDPACQKMIRQAHNPDVLFNDIKERSPEEEPAVDLYFWTPPCQDFSSAGKRRGTKAARGKLMSSSLKYIVRKMPRVAVMENVDSLNSARFAPVLKGVVRALENAGYNVYHSVLDSSGYMVPQIRKRIFVVAIRQDSARHDFVWPEPVGSVTVAKYLDPPTASDKPGRLPSTDRGKERCKTAYAKVFAEGVDPRKTPVLVDVDCSPQFAAVGVNIARTLTRSRGATGGHWVSTRGRRVTVSEMCRLQGFLAREVPWEAAGVTERQIGAMLGNSVAVPVIGAVVAEALYAGGLTSHRHAFKYA